MSEPMMTPPPPAPKSAIARFGTSIVGRPFEWETESSDGSSTEVVTARCVASISFEDTLRYTTGRHAQVAQTSKSAKIMRELLQELDTTADDYVEKFEAIVADRLEYEAATWAAAIDCLLILVREEDRAKLRGPLIKGDPAKVNELRSWLEQRVLAASQDDAESAVSVDPTSRPSPPPSASNPTSGDDSDSEGSPSTD